MVPLSPPSKPKSFTIVSLMHVPDLYIHLITAPIRYTHTHIYIRMCVPDWLFLMSM